ncbi:olfactory receptor 6J1-like [Pantherophis guttatus]|uniref:Olfactory receptor n=1 Tax=Pantherophis guttatus TaxID=94885 RepID=A0A6P9B2N6_PANGU|nr:olfactory receptor 6J1-like [Pantherophis guttatus]XP_060540989.1 olfactory receptor 6J1-like [Pantherophis guttatus]
MGNHTSYEEFILLGFLIGRKAEIFLATMLMVVYTSTIFGNSAILFITITDRCLHTPMYFFLANLSVLDLFFSTVTAPSLLRNLLSGIKTISFASCMAQSYFYFFLATVEYFLLTCMSYDRFVAICNPLHYPVVMNDHFCVQMVMACWLVGFAFVLYPTIMITRFSYCRSNVIDHFFCDSEPLLKLSCTDTSSIQIVLFVLSSIVILCSLNLTLVSYIYIVSAILVIPTGSGRKKAFNTCVSHLTLFLMASSVSILLYVIPSKPSTLGSRKIPAFLSSIINPFLSPFVYTLRNNLVKTILLKLIDRAQTFTVQKAEKFFIIVVRFVGKARI